MIESIPFSNFKIGGRSITGFFQNRRRKWSLNNFSSNGEKKPDYFLFEIYNPNDFPVDLTLEIRPEGEKSHMPFLKLLKTQGFQKLEIPFSEIESKIITTNPFGINITPNLTSEKYYVIFWRDGICLCVDRQVEKSSTHKPRKIKVLVWDLDNTLWDGILVEDGIDNLKLKENVVSIIKDLDSRGILLSIASKNNPDEAIKVLQKCGIDDYFLFPQISWDPKSQSIKQIVKKLNIGIDTVAFIDDSPFERAEVSQVCPEVMCIDAVEYNNLLTYPEFNVPVTSESTKRREFYKNQNCA